MNKLKKIINYVRMYGFIRALKKIYRKICIYKTYSNLNSNYDLWIKNNEPNDKELLKQEKYKFEYNPKISILIPMYNTDESFFYELIDSLKRQTYRNFEACLVDGSNQKNENYNKYIENDSRFKYKFLGYNNGISENTNEALNMSTGEYIALLDHDDLLPPFSLFEIVKCINENLDVEFIYTDEDIIDSKNKRKNPHFKPDYSPDTLRSYNYICHFSVFKKSLLDKIGNLRKKYDGAQDYDLILRATENTDKIKHISKVLYHWRAHNNSTSANVNSKSYAFIAGKEVIKSHLERQGIDAEVQALETPGTYKVEYKLLTQPLVSIIIPNKDSILDLKKCLNSILKSTYKNFEVIIVENNSESKEIFEYYKEIEKKFKNIKVTKLKDKGFNFSKIVNYGRSFAKGDYLLLLNNDVQVINNNWIEEMLGICMQKNVGIVGAKLLYPDDTVQHAGVVIGVGGVAGHIHKNIDDSDPGYFSRANIINNFSAVTAACMMIKAKIYDEVNGFDERIQVAFNDVDFCMKVRENGYLIVYTPFSKLYHYESKSRGEEDTPEKKKRFANEIKLFQSKWYNQLLKGDPYFNKNFRLDSYLFVIDTEKNK